MTPLEYIVCHSFQTAMEVMGLVGVIVNVALIGLSGQVDRIFPNITTNQTILLIILLEVSEAANQHRTSQLTIKR